MLSHNIPYSQCVYISDGSTEKRLLTQYMNLKFIGWYIFNKSLHLLQMKHMPTINIQKRRKQNILFSTMRGEYSSSIRCELFFFCVFWICICGFICVKLICWCGAYNRRGRSNHTFNIHIRIPSTISSPCVNAPSLCKPHPATLHK